MYALLIHLKLYSNISINFKWSHDLIKVPEKYINHFFYDLNFSSFLYEI